MPQSKMEAQHARCENACREGERVPEADLYWRTLRRAAEIVGDEEVLARRLKVTPSHLTLWIQGVEKPPTYVFLRTVDLLSERDFPKS